MGNFHPGCKALSGLIAFCVCLGFFACVIAIAEPTTRPVVPAAVGNTATSKTVDPATTSPVRCEFWHQVPGAQITDTLSTSQLDRAPDETRWTDKMECTPACKDEYACSVSAIITAPSTGYYRFDIPSRDTGILYLSTDESAEHRRFTAQTPASTDLHGWHYYSSQTSNGVKLITGQRYFIQAIFKSGPGPGNLSIGWTLPNGIFQGPIPPDRFSLAAEDPRPPHMHFDQLQVTLKPEAPTTQPGIHKFVRGATVNLDGQAHDMSYLMCMPQDYATTTDQKGMMIFLHGNSRQGYTLEGVEQNGPMHHIETRKDLREWMPLIVLCPQLPPEWRWDSPGVGHAVNGLVEQLCQRYPRIDRRRIYITGLSMGGKGTWLTLEDSPQTYAAAAPISAVDVRPDLAPQLLKDIGNLHIICGSQDGGFTGGSHRMYEALKPALGDRVQLSVFEHEGHGVWDHYYPNKSFYEELMKCSRPADRTTQPVSH